MNNLKALIITVLYLSCSSLFSQIPPPPEYEWKVNYTETTKTYFKVGSNTTLTKLDKGRLKETKEVSFFEKYYTADSNMPLTFIEKDQSRNSYKDFMIKPKKFVIDDHGISAYGSKGELLKTIYHTKKYYDLAKFRHRKAFLSFTTITEEDLRKFKASTDNIEIDENGTITATSLSGTLIYNPVRKTKIVIKNNDNGEPESTTFTQYIPIVSIFPEYPNDEDVLPLYIKDVVNEELPSGACAEFVKIKIYDDYILDGGNQAQLRRANKDDNSIVEPMVYPNPVMDVLTIHGFGKSAFEVNIYSIEGTLILTEQHLGLAQIDIEKFQNGVYIVCMISEGKETIRKIIKQ